MQNRIIPIDTVTNDIRFKVCKTIYSKQEKIEEESTSMFFFAKLSCFLNRRLFLLINYFWKASESLSQILTTGKTKKYINTHLVLPFASYRRVRWQYYANQLGFVRPSPKRPSFPKKLKIKCQKSIYCILNSE